MNWQNGIKALYGKTVKLLLTNLTDDSILTTLRAILGEVSAIRKALGTRGEP